LILKNVSVTNDGDYDVIVSNAYGSVTSSVVTLTVHAPPSTVTIQPPYQFIASGSNMSFTAVANGTPPLNYQWQFNGSNIDWATNSSLTLTNVQAANEGGYDIVVSNSFGSITSSNALLTDLGTALNSPGLIWTNVSVLPWFPETNVTHDGLEAMQSGSVPLAQHSKLQATVDGPGTLSFWWNISSPSGDLVFSVNGVTQGFISGSTGWRQQIFYLGSGSQTLLWDYFRFTSVGSNAAWLDQVSFTLGGTAPILTAAPSTAYVRANANVSLAAGAEGTPPLNYQWQFNAATITNQTNATLNLPNVQPANSGNYSVIITNNYGSISTNANLFVELFAINVASTNPSTSTNGFQLTLNGVLTTNPVIVSASTDLLNWLPIYTNPATTGSVPVLDITASNFPARFYRGQE
jgi:hypothetical protein